MVLISLVYLVEGIGGGYVVWSRYGGIFEGGFSDRLSFVWVFVGLEREGSSG